MPVTKDTFTEGLEDETWDEVDAEEKKKLRYPENTEGYGASIKFTLMETKTFADVKGEEENSSFSTMSKTFAQAKSAALGARSARKAAKSQEKIAKNLEMSVDPLEALRGPLAGSVQNKKSTINFFLKFKFYWRRKHFCYFISNIFSIIPIFL